MKVVDVAEFYAVQGGGVKTYIHQKLEAGSRLGHEVVIVAPGPEDGEEERYGGRIIWVKGPPMPFDPRYYVLWNEKAVHRILDREKPDVVEGSSPWSGGWFAARWKGQAKKAFIFHQDPVAVYPQTFLGGVLGRERVDALFGPYWAYLRTLSRRFDHTIVSGHWLADKLQGFGVQNAVAVPFGIDKGRFSPSHREEALKREWLSKCGLTGSQLDEASLWVCISRFHPEKRLPTLFKAFERLSRERPMGLVVFGDGPLRESIQAMAAKIPNVHLVGFCQDRALVSRTLASADAFLHGSSAETYGLVVAEALCSGLPLVVPDLGGAADLAGPEYAEVYPAGKVDACVDAMRRLLDRDLAMLSQAAQQASQVKVRSLDEHFEGLFKLYAS